MNEEVAFATFHVRDKQVVLHQTTVLVEQRHCLDAQNVECVGAREGEDHSGV